MKGLIICGYPGIGKSHVGGWNNCIDLESGFFSYRNGMPQKTEYWVPQYCGLAVDLALQGYTVLVSTHKEVIQQLMMNKEWALHGDTVIFCPDHRYKNEWVKRLEKRYNTDRSEKNKRSLERVKEHFRDDLSYMHDYGLPIYMPAAMDYDLKDYITMIQNTRCKEEAVHND